MADFFIVLGKSNGMIRQTLPIYSRNLTIYNGCNYIPVTLPRYKK